MKRLTPQLFDRLRELAPRGYLDLANVLGGAAVRNVLRGIFKIIIAGFLTPQALGVLRSIYSLFRIVASLAGFGLDYAMVTFVAAALKKEGREGSSGEYESKQILHTVLLLKLVIVIALALVGNLLAPWLTRWALGDPSLEIYTRWIFLALGGQLLWKYISSYLSAHQQFKRLALFFTTVPVLMLGTTLVLLALDRFTLEAGIAIHLFAPAVATLIWWFAARMQLGGAAAWDSAVARKIFRFSRWIYLANVASANRNHINPLLLKQPGLSGSLAAGELNAGLYSFGNDLANEVTVFSQSLFTVLLPKASGQSSPEQLRRFLARAYRHVALLIVFLAALVFAAKPFILLLGAIKESYLSYLPSLQVFAILYVGALFTIAAIPMRTALYTMNLPQIGTYLEVVTTVLLVVGCLLLIPRYGAEGAALAVLAQRVISLILLVVLGMRRLRTWQPQE